MTRARSRGVQGPARSGARATRTRCSRTGSRRCGITRCAVCAVCSWCPAEVHVVVRHSFGHAERLPHCCYFGSVYFGGPRSFLSAPCCALLVACLRNQLVCSSACLCTFSFVFHSSNTLVIPISPAQFTHPPSTLQHPCSRHHAITQLCLTLPHIKPHTPSQARYRECKKAEYEGLAAAVETLTAQLAAMKAIEVRVMCWRNMLKTFACGGACTCGDTCTDC